MCVVIFLTHKSYDTVWVNSVSISNKSVFCLILCHYRLSSLQVSVLFLTAPYVRVDLIVDSIWNSKRNTLSTMGVFDLNKLLFFSILWLTARTADIESSLGPQSRLRAALFPLSSKSSEGTPAAAVPAMVESAITTTTTAEPTTISLMVTSPATTEYETTIKAVSCPNGQDPIIDVSLSFY